VLPAHERLHADDAPRLEVDERLVAQRELLLAHRPAQFVGQRDAIAHLDVHLGMERGRLRLALALGHVHGDVGVAEQLLVVK
jgi:hypothetical protein